MGVSRGLLFLLALASGLTVANTYYAQPLLDSIARGLHAGTAETGLLVTLGQLGYAAGLLLLVPLADRLDRRRLVTLLMLSTVLALVGAAAGVNIGMLAVAITVVGVTSVVAQIFVPFAATLAPPGDRGRVVGAVMTGLMLGVLLARTLAGLVADAAGGWRSVFWLSAVLAVGLTILLHRKLPDRPSAARGSYASLLRSVGALMLREPVLQRRSAYGALSFGLVSVFWTPVAFLLARPPYGFGEAAIGLFGLVGVPAALLAPRAGRLADKGYSGTLTGAYFAVALAGLALALVGSDHLAALAGGAFLITFGAQAVHVTNQSEIYRLDAAAHNRITTGYMTAFFVGGMAGSASATALYATYGWPAVPVLGAAFAAAALLLWLAESLTRRGSPSNPMEREEATGGSHHARDDRPEGLPDRVRHLAARR
ncbi:MAG: MFS transporter [Streptosporangiales bacterium]|nr:MFS transporter [Streptosporangiales bacterium]